MPATLGFLLFQIGAPLFLVNAVTLASGTTLFSVAALAVSVGASLAARLLTKSPEIPKPEDGKYNLRQTVPSLARIYGRVKKGGDYVFLEERDGAAFHIIVTAGHRINRFVQHWLHDEEVTVDLAGIVTIPTHFSGKVSVQTQLGLDVEVPFALIYTYFPEIWGTDYPGDGLAKIVMTCGAVAQADFQSVYPQGMPQHTAEIEGALLWDPRDPAQIQSNPATHVYSENLALIRLDHLLHEAGMRLSVDVIHLPDWIIAANVCDQLVLNRSGASEPRYHGGGWYRYNNRPADVGAEIDKSADFVLYESDQGKVGVHAGAWVDPDITLTGAAIKRVHFDANRHRAGTCIAARGRYTSPNHGYNTVDAAVIGNPYVADDDDRSIIVEAPWVQRHNHCQRLQKLGIIRANAPRVTIVADYASAVGVLSRRFVRVDRAPMLDNAVVEIAGRPKISLADLTITFDGLVVPASLYSFIAADEEGIPPPVVVDIEASVVPVPEDLAISMQREVVAAGQTAAFAVVSWTVANAALSYELEFSALPSGPVSRWAIPANQASQKVAYLADGVTYQFRIRAVSAGGQKSEWSDYVSATAVADATPPGVPTGVSGTGGVGTATIDWISPASSNLASCKVYRNTVNVFGSAVLVATYPMAPSTAASKVYSLAAGTFYFWVTSANGSGVQSAEVATGAVVVT